MKYSQFLVSSLFVNVVVIGCAKSPTDDDPQPSTTSSTSTTSTASNASGSVTGAPGSTNPTEVTGAPGSTSPTEVTTGGSTPTSATATGATSEGCSSENCPDMMIGCDTWTQDCPDGQKCTYYSEGGDNWDAQKCVDVTGTDKPGDACTAEGALTGIDSCVEGAICWNVDMNGVGTCIGLCGGSFEAPICGPSSVCNFGRLLSLCIPNCDPLLQDCPDPGDLCISNGDTFVCIVDLGGEEGQANDPCEFANVCDPGLTCLDPPTAGAGCDQAAGGCCTPFCPFPDGACPNPDQQCVQWFDPMMLPENDPQLDIGFCGVPG